MRRCAYWNWDTAVSRLSQWTELGDVYILIYTFKTIFIYPPVYLSTHPPIEIHKFIGIANPKTQGSF